MRKPSTELKPNPLSHFIRVKCKVCGNEQILYDRTSHPINCNICETALAAPKGGKAELNADTIETLPNA